MAECECCGSYITTWNEQRERLLEDEIVKELLLSLDGDWRKVADNAVQRDLPDGYVAIIVRPYIKELD